jgi:hypothetical protein
MATIAHNTPQSTARAATPRKVTPYQESAEPSWAASIIPVLVAFGSLTALIVGAAFFGGKLLAVFGSLLGGW